MTFDFRHLAVAAAGFSTFLHLYAPQALLPELAREFGVGAAQISAMITASTLAIALTAPFTGAVADVLGRKRLITTAMFAVALPVLMETIAAAPEALVFWRFIEGLLLPPIFTVVLAYVGDEWPPAEVAGVAGLYVSASSLGGFCGRLVPGIVGDIAGWRYAFLAIAMIGLAGAVVVATKLPREKRFVRSEGFLASGRQMLRHLRNPQLIATCAVGFGVLFNFVAIFTYVSFRLAAPPYNFTPSLLGAVFFTYLVGAVATPWTGRVVMRYGRRPLMMCVLSVWLAGLALLLASPLTLILIGLSLCAGCGMMCQATSTGYVTASASEGRSSAIGLYVSSFYVGGSVGGAVAGVLWSAAGWWAVVALSAVVVAMMGMVVIFVWSAKPARG
ncbi:MAG TPA: MFS transporter [Xanthobacteraceae bacterium]|jgi:predicted MFS family arabinose efflux permease|nr:MFS transporter [Xanthobacteraceae bacterium]